MPDAGHSSKRFLVKKVLPMHCAPYKRTALPHSEDQLENFTTVKFFDE
jgi:hypothetical protein